ncbi:MAG TPA: MerR family transcriptional regulator [Solirubrobacteraceae bacterium]|jgi:DNA-binding transcriptional MerR regulator|nr:MerR family transcriptional regulator [Solirubrobacteraceae bacterium]
MPADLTIEQLAAETGMTVRNIRAHQARGLLDPPEVRLRVGYYDAEHVARLKLIQELQDDGFNLAGIKRLVEDDQATAQRLARFRQAVNETAEASQTLTVEELGRRFRVSPEEAPQVLARAETLGVLVAAGEDRYEVPSPSLLAVAEHVVARGVSLNEALTVFKQVELHCDAVSGAFVSLFMREVWEPFEAAGMPTERWTEIDETIAQLRPLATDALEAIFGQRMSAQIDAAFGERIQQLAPPPQPGDG